MKGLDDMELLKEMLKELSLAPGAPGFEGPVASLMKKWLSPHFETRTDAMGNVMFFKEASGLGGDAPTILLDAHMDEVAFLVADIKETGFLSIHNLGGWREIALTAQRFIVHGATGKAQGMIVSLPPHFSKDVKDTVPKIENLLLDIGASTRQEVADMGFRLGDPVVPVPVYDELGSAGRRLLGKAWDDRVGCAVMARVMLEMKETILPYRLIAAATVQEEVGTRGATVVSNYLHPDLAIVLEGTPADDIPGATTGTPQGALGKGVQIRLFDPKMIPSRQLNDALIAAAAEKGLPHQLAVRRGGGTNGGMLHMAGRGCHTAVLGVPVRSAHSNCGIIDLSDVESAADLTIHFLEGLDGEWVRKLGGA